MAYIVHFLSDWADQDPNCLPITRRFICMLDYVMSKPVFVSLAVDQPSVTCARMHGSIWVCLLLI